MTHHLWGTDGNPEREMTKTQSATRERLTTIPELKSVSATRPAPQGHWVGDGFPVRTIFAYDDRSVSPFLLMDYAGPAVFRPSEKRRGVGEHPHRGFETVTIMYSGEVEHRDSAGAFGKIGPGDVQWMTAGSGIVHEEMHSVEYSNRGGPFEAIQLWVNLPAQHKMTKPSYQTLLARDIPEVDLADGAGTARIIAGDFGEARGPAKTFTPVNLWDVRLKAGKDALFELPPSHMAALFVLKGGVSANGLTKVGASEFVTFSRDGGAIQVHAEIDSTLLILGGEPIDEPVVGYGPFVMNTETEIRRAIEDYRSGLMGHLSP
jgi:redox-sensitive bicupin YhaK (pirin superfamily)